jgi:hypothetical protein
MARAGSASMNSSAEPTAAKRVNLTVAGKDAGRGKKADFLGSTF